MINPQTDEMVSKEIACLMLEQTISCPMQRQVEQARILATPNCLLRNGNTELFGELNAS